jgi:hypothetical protein
MYMSPGWTESWIKGECAGVTCRGSSYGLGWDLEERRQWGFWSQLGGERNEAREVVMRDLCPGWVALGE